MSFIRKILLISFVLWRGEFLACGLRAPAHNDLLQYKYEGNFYPMYATDGSQGFPNQLIISPVQISHQIYHDYQEEEPVPLAAVQVQPLKRVTLRGDAATKHAVGESQQEIPPQADSVNRQYHDIFLKLKSPHELVFGHVLNWPDTAEKKVETRTRNNYRGQVVWADPTGGYGEHYWDLAQGAL